MILRAAILGAGGMGQRHAQSLRDIASISIRAVCDTQEEAAAQLAQRCGAKAYTDFRQMLDREKPEVLFVCLPPFAHSGEVEMAAGLGIHLFLEKPIALEEECARQMVEAVEKSGVIAQVGYHYRFGGAVRVLRDWMESGRAGRPVLFNGRYECNALHSPWWRRKEMSGSQMLEQAIHLYDMAIFLMGKPVSAVGYMDNLCHTEVPAYTVEDVSGSIMRFQSGAIGTITATNCAVPGKWEAPFTAVFENVTAHFSDPNHAVFWDTSGAKPEKSVISRDTDMYAEEVRAFIEAVRTGKRSSCPITEGYESLRLVAQISKNSGKEVS